MRVNLLGALISAAVLTLLLFGLHMCSKQGHQVHSWLAASCGNSKAQKTLIFALMASSLLTIASLIALAYFLIELFTDALTRLRDLLIKVFRTKNRELSRQS